MRMNLKDQVVSLELAKKLKELGFKHDSHFKWTYHANLAKKGEWGLDLYIARLLYNEYHAFTASEVLEMLPATIKTWGILTITKLQGYSVGEGYEIVYKQTDGTPMSIHCLDIHLANAAAKMLIYLKENKLV